MKNIFFASLISSQKLLCSARPPVATSGKSFFSHLILCKLTLFFCALLIAGGAFGQTQDEKDEAFRKVLTDRSAKIVNTLGITDSVKYRRLVKVVSNQYYEVNKVQDQFKATVKEIKARQLPGNNSDSLILQEDQKKSAQLTQLHGSYIGQLNKDLATEQVDKVKDGMTYNILEVTYKAYEEMILNLTNDQKEKIYGWLKEARELAMDEGSSEDKHKVFGKYKGRINNYLSTEGYDMKKEEKDWQERLKKKG